ncbi:hypothetical protein MMC24_006571 [Lignoscripta atroalba]|nr:hypothetical protein [Lignoscripta atroalba]
MTRLLGGRSGLFDATSAIASANKCCGYLAVTSSQSRAVVVFAASCKDAAAAAFQGRHEAACMKLFVDFEGEHRLGVVTRVRILACDKRAIKKPSLLHWAACGDLIGRAVGGNLK